MSRIRSIHPGLWTDEAFMGLSAFARLLFIGLWNEAWDDGVFEWKPLTIKAKLFPADNVDVKALLTELENAGSIASRDDPKPYGLIRNFQTYQRPKKPNSSGLLRDEDREYVGAVPHQFGTNSEKPPQMEDGGGRMEEKEEPAPLPPAAPETGARDLFDEVWEGFPRHPASSKAQAHRAFKRLTPDEQAAVLPAVQHYARWLPLDAANRKRSVDESLQFVPHLATWIHTGAWKEAHALPVAPAPQPMPDVVYLDRYADEALFSACERVRDKPVPKTMNRWGFPAEVVDLAKGLLREAAA